ncbi:MAG: pyrophosphatase [Patescibacteria group bacterium]
MDLAQLTDKIELVSSKYAEKVGVVRDRDWFAFKLQEELGELTQKYLMMTERGRKKGLTDEEIRLGFEDEVADVLGQLLLLAKHFDVDLEKALERKWFAYLDE